MSPLGELSQDGRFSSSLPTSKSHTRESWAEDPSARRVEWNCLSKPSFHSLLVALEPWQSYPRLAQGSRMLTCGCVVGPGYPHSVPGGSHSPPLCAAGLFQQIPLWVQKSTSHSRHPLPISACATECLTCTRVFPEVPGPLLIDPVQVTCRAWGWFALMVATLLCVLGLAWRGTPLTLAQCSVGTPSPSDQQMKGRVLMPSCL